MTTAALPVRQVGTLFIKGDSIAAGYWNKHEATKETFQGQWINTHDKFLVNEDGFFWYAGRTDDMIKVSGQAVWPSEVEALLQEHPAVLESGVVGMADPDGLIKPIAYVALKDGQAGSPRLADELQEFVKSRTARTSTRARSSSSSRCQKRLPARSSGSSSGNLPPPAPRCTPSSAARWSPAFRRLAWYAFASRS